MYIRRIYKGDGIEKKTQIQIEKLEDLEQLYPRFELDWKTAERYREAIDNGEKFPPILVGLFESDYYIIDGAHRVEAHKRLGKKIIPAIIRTYKDKKSIFIDAVKANMKHGKPLSYGERLNIIAKFKNEFKLSPAEISAITAFKIEKIEKFIISDITARKPWQGSPSSKADGESEQRSNYGELDQFIFYLDSHPDTLQIPEARHKLETIYAKLMAILNKQAV